MANNLWATKYPAFGKLEQSAQRAYFAKIFGSYKAMYASASAPAETEEDEERAEQLVAQTKEVCKRQHCYRTEIFQLQDLFIGEKHNVNEALIAHSTLAIMQSTAARVGLMTRTRHDERTVRWKKENPQGAQAGAQESDGQVCWPGEATSQMQLNWRRVKKEYMYFSVYLFRSAVTANAVSAVRRTTTVLRAM